VAEGTIDPSTPCFQVWLDEGGDEAPKPHWVPFSELNSDTIGEIQTGIIELGGRAFVRTLGDALVAADRVVRIEHFPLPPWGETPEGE
jgi:hypothetical protein